MKDSLAGLGLTVPFHCRGGLGSIPGQGIKLLHAIQPSHPLLPPSPALNRSQQQGPFQ